MDPDFCEKPLAGNLEETIAIAAEIDASGIPFQLGFQRRFDAGYAEAHRLIQSGALGTLYNIRLAGHDPAPPHEAYIAQSGGLFRDFSVHDFDVLRFMTGCEVEEVYADGAVRGFPVFEKYDDVDTAVVAMRLTDWPIHGDDRGAPRPARLRHPGRDLRARRTASRSGSARTRPSARSSLVCLRRPVPSGPTSSFDSNRPMRPSSQASSRWRAATSQALVRPRTALRLCASPRRPLARSTNTARCGSRRSPAEGGLRPTPRDVGTKGGVHGGQRGREGRSIPRLRHTGG
jgi:hypothetical protein